MKFIIRLNRNGMAMVYLKQEKFSLAEFHFSRATTIFRTNPDLICHLAVVRKNLLLIKSLLL
jgi:hypothetical protein